jgi:hypothetical protein
MLPDSRRAPRPYPAGLRMRRGWSASVGYTSVRSGNGQAGRRGTAGPADPQFTGRPRTDDEGVASSSPRIGARRERRGRRLDVLGNAAASRAVRTCALAAGADTLGLRREAGGRLGTAEFGAGQHGPHSNRLAGLRTDGSNTSGFAGGRRWAGRLGPGAHQAPAPGRRARPGQLGSGRGDRPQCRRVDLLGLGYCRPVLGWGYVQGGELASSHPVIGYVGRPGDCEIRIGGRVDLRASGVNNGAQRTEGSVPQSARNQDGWHNGSVSGHRSAQRSR